MKEWNATTIRMAKARKLLSATLVPDMGGRASSRRQKKTAIASREREGPAASARYCTAFRRPYNGDVPSRKNLRFAVGWNGAQGRAEIVPRLQILVVSHLAGRFH